MKEMLWHEQYNLGIDEIDHMHQRMFYLLKTLVSQNETGTEKDACRETIHFLRKYALHHFASEERYMQYMGYEGYQMHKKLHDQLRDVSIPALDDELEREGYSKEAVGHFIGVCVGWFAGHILVEDRAIVGKPVSGWIYGKEEADWGIAKAAEQVFRVLSGKSEILDESYDGRDLDHGIYSRLRYVSANKETVQVVIGIEERAILTMFGEMLGIENPKLDASIPYAARQMFCQLVKLTAVNKMFMEQYLLDKEELILYGQLYEMTEKSAPSYHILYDVGYGRLAFYVFR